MRFLAQCMLTMVCTGAWAQTMEGDLLIRNIVVVDVVHGELRKGQDVLIKGDQR